MGDLMTMAMAMLRGHREDQPAKAVEPHALTATVVQRQSDRLRAYAREWVVASCEGGVWPSLPDDAEAQVDREMLARLTAWDESASDPTRLKAKLAAIQQNMMVASAAGNIPSGSAHVPKPRLVEDDMGTVTPRPRALPPPAQSPQPVQSPQSDYLRDRWGYVDGNLERLRRGKRGGGPPGARVWNLLPMPSRPIPRRGQGPHWIRERLSVEEEAPPTPSDSRSLDTP